VNRRVAVERHTGSARPASSNRHFSRVRPRGALARAAHAPPPDPGDRPQSRVLTVSTTHTARPLTSWRRARQCAKRTEPDDVSVNNSARSTSQLGTQHITEPIERIRLTGGSFA
jgi:hypothetical protein